MSQVLERLLPAVLRHLSGNIIDDENFTDQAEGTQTPQLIHGPGRCSADMTPGTRAISNAHNTGDSACRWRRCLELWSHLLGSNRLFLALLFHSGSLWAVEWSPSASSLAPESSVLERERPWSEAVMWFLQIREVAVTPLMSGNNEWVMGAVEGCKEEVSSSLHMYSEDEAMVQRVATSLLGGWFAMVDRCGRRFSRAYYFSCALKVVALVRNTALIEDIPHLRDLVAMEPRSVSQFSAFSSILCCLLVEEARQHPFCLRLPPPFFLLNFNAIGCGSRIGVWLPRKVAAGVSGGRAQQDGEFHSCQVCSPGVMLRLPSSSSSSSSCNTSGDLVLGVQLLSEAYVQSIGVLPVMQRRSGDQCHHHAGEEKKQGRGRRHAATSGTTAEEMSPPRCWSALCPATQSYIRVDLLHPRNLATIVLSSSPSLTGTVGRRRGKQQQHEVTATTAPLRLSSRSTVLRDPLVTIVFALATTARRLIGCRGLFLQQSHDSGAELRTACSGKSATGPHSNTETQHTSPNTTNKGKAGAAAGASSSSSLRFSSSFRSAEEELDCLIECALHLLLEALLLCHDISSDLVPQVDAWAVEVLSNAVDLALATAQPVVRHLQAVGYALCLALQAQHSLLVTVGLLVTLAQRQRDWCERQTGNNNSSSISICTGWWEVFKGCVLKDEIIPGQLCKGTWELVERVERSLRAVQHVRLRKQQLKHKQQSSPALVSDTPRAVDAGVVREGDFKRDDEVLHPRLTLPLRRQQAGEVSVAKRFRDELQPPPTWLRVAGAVEVDDKHSAKSMGDMILSLWWSLERAAASAM